MSRLPVLVLLALLAGCGAPPAMDSISASRQALSGGCPNGWYDAAVVSLLCADGFSLEYKTFAGTVCVTCSASTAKCNGPWTSAAAEFACGAGYEMKFNHAGTCKRCMRSRTGGPECQADADCFRTGCSGQYCASENLVSTCEFRPEYACYADEYCGCQNGKCGWANDPVLEQCITDAQSDGSTISL